MNKKMILSLIDSLIMLTSPVILWVVGQFVEVTGVGCIVFEVMYIFVVVLFYNVIKRVGMDG